MMTGKLCLPWEDSVFPGKLQISTDTAFKERAKWTSIKNSTDKADPNMERDFGQKLNSLTLLHLPSAPKVLLC